MTDERTEIGDEDDRFWIMGADLDRTFSLEAAMLEFSRLFRHEENNDRGLVIIGAAFLDILLEHILVTFLVDDPKEVAQMLRYDQALGTYGNRSRAVYCLGLIPRVVFDDLRLVGKIRNRFAHDLYASFDDPQIASWSTSLKWHRQTYMVPPDDAIARDLFHVGANQLAGHLDGVVSIARGEKRKIPGR